MLEKRAWVLRNERIARNAIEAISSLDIDRRHPWVVRVSKQQDSKTQQQLGYIWAVIYPLIGLQLIGEDDAQSVHDTCIASFAPIVTYRWGNSMRQRRKGLSEMTTPEASEYIDRLIRFAAENGVVIPAPQIYYEDENASKRHRSHKAREVPQPEVA